MLITRLAQSQYRNVALDANPLQLVRHGAGPNEGKPPWCRCPDVSQLNGCDPELPHRIQQLFGFRQRSEIGNDGRGIGIGRGYNAKCGGHGTYNLP